MFALEVETQSGPGYILKLEPLRLLDDEMIRIVRQVKNDFQGFCPEKLERWN